MKLVFAGTPEAAVPSLRALLDSQHEVVAVVTRPDAVSGRGRKVSPSPVAEVAAEAGIEVLKPAKASEPDFLARLRALEPDCCPVVAYGALLRKEALAIPRHGWINLHFSLLPAWRGAAPVQHAVLHGDDITGAATFQIEPALDSGPVYGVVTEPIGPRDTSGVLLERLSHSGAELLVRTLDGVAAGSLESRPQNEDGVSYAAKLNPEDAEVDFHAPALRIDRLIRACDPAPGAWTVFRGTRLKLGPVALVEDAPALPPGRLEIGKKHVLVGTATRSVRLGHVQPQGKRMMPAVDWARGVRPGDDERLGSA
ncbi:methionyl-tRNA formyltransferase [Nocardiopsis ansamitocini]|uniref:Methionyl-tRNA formyltransferase n=1 Tax=Nocardiopsis ansamitocini TaxID=1670832 RepID=A0A9W6P2Q7_9ACTN|nr:methionyl-tRNA formyltransferase [Nocardiopsis ansamitocini]GLU46017.1 methionyl-tRNA formyltransferase [Nocardiopsis ansamitocini]